ncbi:hypothetical protein ACWIUD_05395 [Helicobacter sp. 23-1044]
MNFQNKQQKFAESRLPRIAFAILAMTDYFRFCDFRARFCDFSCNL